MDNFSIGGFAWRIAFALALALVLLTFNPAGWSYYPWLSGNFPAITPMQAVVGVGISWAIVRRELTGQASVDQVEENH
jgi:hypothetical protein